MHCLCLQGPASCHYAGYIDRGTTELRDPHQTNSNCCQVRFTFAADLAVGPASVIFSIKDSAAIFFQNYAPSLKSCLAGFVFRFRMWMVQRWTWLKQQ